MADKLDRIEDKLDKLTDKVSEVSENVIKNTATLQEHQRRSLANEESVEILKQELAPLKEHVAAWGIAGKFAVALAGLAGFLAALAEIYQAFN